MINKNCSILVFLSITLLSFSFATAQIGWVQKANYGGIARDDVGFFVIGNYAYAGTGYNGTNLTDFWKYDPSTNTWSGGIAPYPGAGQYSPTSFSYNGLGYCGLGFNFSTLANDLWCYDPTTNTWTAKASLPGPARYDAPCFVIGHKVWVIAGNRGGPPYYQDVWMYDINQDKWTKMNNFPGGNISSCLTFAIGNHGYAGAGWDGSNMHSAFWEYDTASDTWTSIAPIPARAAGLAGMPHCFVIGSKAYACTGLDGTWKSMPVGFVYDTVTKAWCSFSHEGIAARSYGMAFVLNGKGYMGVGVDTTGIWNGPFRNDFWEYDPKSTFTVSDTNLCSGSGLGTAFSGITSLDSSASPLTWNWTFTGGTPGTSTSQYPNVTYSTGGSYNVEMIVSSSCSGMADTVIRSITIVGGSSIPITLTGNTSICTGQVDTLTVAGGGTYTWSNGSTTSSIIVSPTSNTTYSVQVNNGGCKKDTTLTVNVGPKLTIIISGTDTVCAGNSVTLSASGGKSYSYTWSNGATTSSITISPATTTNYSVAVTNGICSGDSNLIVAIIPPPKLTVSATSISICQGDTSTITASGGRKYLWSNGSTTSSITVTPESTTTYTVVTSNGYCSTDTSVTITINKKPVAIITGGHQVCSGTNITLTASGGQDYEWFPSTGLSSTTGSTVTATPNVPITYTVIALSGKCSDTATSTLTVLPAPSATVCCNDTIQMGDTVSLSAAIIGANGFNWTPDTYLSCDTCPNTKAFPKFTTTYAVVMNDTDGCQKIDSVVIFVEGCGNIWIPNAFSPNGDGRNDVFAPKGACMVSYTMYIFDRWGNKLYYTNNSQPWNGKVNSEIAQEDTYVYMITTYDGLKKTRTFWGRVTIVK